MEGQVIAELTVVPVGTGDARLSKYIASCIEILKSRQDLTYQLTAMGTIVQGPLDKILEVTRQMHEVPFTMGAQRVVTSLKIDDRRDRPSTMATKVDSVLKLIR